MTPDHLTIQAATPKCPRVVHRLGLVRRCGHPMRYLMPSNQWKCKRCLQTVVGERMAEWNAEADAALGEAA